MGLSLMSPLPDQQRRISELTAALEAADQRGDRLEGELRTERRKNATIEKGVAELRAILSPLYQALGMIFGQIEAMGISGTSSPSTGTGMDPRKAAIWEDWKRKMPGIPARFIDALMMHGELTQAQLRLHAKCAVGSVAGVVSQLYKAGLISKNGGKVTLKEL